MADERDPLARLRRAVQSESAPPDLAARIRQRIAAEPAPSIGWPHWRKALIAVTASLAVLTLYQVIRLRFDPEAISASLLASLPSSMRAGLDNHLHCSVYGEIPPDAPPLEEAVRYLPAQFTGLLRTVERHAPHAFRLYSAHVCSRGARQFVHFQLKSDSRLLSVIVTRREADEKFVRERIAPALAASGRRIFEASAKQYQVAAITEGGYTAYVVSDLPSEENTRILAAMAPEVTAFLSVLKA
jgi:hypothetical protein